MLFESIFFPGQLINKTSYIYELLQSKYSPNKIRELAHCGPNKIYRVQEMINSHAPPTAFYDEPKRGRPLIVTEQVKTYIALRGPGCISDAKLAQEIKLNFGHLQKLSRSTIHFYRHNLNFLIL